MTLNRRSSLFIALSAVVMSLPFLTRAAEVNVGADVVSAYVFRGETINADPVLQPAVEATQNGFSLGVWGNMDLGSDEGEYERNEFSEIDLFLTYTLELEAVSLLRCNRAARTVRVRELCGRGGKQGFAERIHS